MLRTRFVASSNRTGIISSSNKLASSAGIIISPLAVSSSKLKSDTAASASATAGASKKEGFLTEAKKEKLILGALGATCSSMSVLGVCHLFVCQVPLTVAGGSVAGAALTGALGVFEGEGSGGAGFGTAIGIFLGGVGAWYAKSQDQPWSTGKK